MNTFTMERNNYRRKLIMLVKQHPILWNKTQENYNRNRPQKILAWHQISEQLEISVDKLRRTWENLRDQYRRDLKREVNFGFKSKWRFFADMNFIRAMVSCKEHGFKETEYTDSDSELDVTDNPNGQTQCAPISTTLVPPITIPTITTPCSSTISSNTTCDTNTVPFQPIVLTKQWQPIAEHIPEANFFAPHTPAANELVSFPTNCDSSKDFMPSSNASLPYENIAKQELETELESDAAAATAAAMVEQQQESTPRQDNPNDRDFQEPCVSTSSNKPCRASIEEVSDTPLPGNSRSQLKHDTDMNVKDDDYYFVMSLLPSLRQIPRNRKFPLRIGIMSLIAKDLEEVCKE